MTTYRSNQPASIQTSSMSLKTMGLSNTLYFSMEFTYTKVQKKGFVNKFKKNKHPMDIDVACLLFDDNKECIEKIWYKKLRDSSEAIRHNGDDLHGHRPNKIIDNLDLRKDLEQIELRLDKLKTDVQQIVLIVSSYTGDALAKVKNGKINLDDENANQAMTSIFSNLPNDCHTLWVATIKRANNDWLFEEIKKPIDSFDPKSLEKVVQEISKKLT